MPNSRGLPFVDANVIIRLLTGDDPEKQTRTRALFRKVETGSITVALPATVIFECIFVLTSPRLYHLAKEQAVGLLLPIVRLPHLRLSNKRIVLRAFDIWVATPLGFGDAYIAAAMEQSESATLYSFDRGFDRVKGIKRIEP
jgi:predicted nucleic acid-binding protein